MLKYIKSDNYKKLDNMSKAKNNPVMHKKDENENLPVPKPRGNLPVLIANERIELVTELLLTRQCTIQALHKLADKEGWGVSERQLYYYKKRAEEVILGASKVRLDTELGKAISTINLLIQKAIDAKDINLALKCQKELNSLFGLYAPKQVMQGKPEDFRKFIIQDKTRQIEEVKFTETENNGNDN